MAQALKHKVKLDLTNKDGQQAVLIAETNKGFRGGIRSDVKVNWAGDQFESHVIYEDFMKCLKTTTGRATQRAIEAQHDAVFTAAVLNALVAEARAFYAAKDAKDAEATADTQPEVNECR